MDDDSLEVWGRLRDFERKGLVDRELSDIFGCMLDTMQADVRRILPTYIAWLQDLQEVVDAS
jgi:hypothetical protein